MKYDNQLRYAVNIIKDYDGRHPLSAWLKDFFRDNKQMGSRDRKTVSELVYGYFRLGHNPSDNIEERILAALFAGNHLSGMVEYFKPRYNEIREFPTSKIFPWNNLLSDGIDPEAFASSFLQQPNLFIRIRPGNRQQVITKLDATGIPYTVCGDACISLPNSTRIDAVLQLNREAVVQDKSSQQTGELIKNITATHVWDCCAASGGKSIMVHDLFNNIDITVSDIRESIISNLKKRLQEAGIANYRSFIADLSHANARLPDKNYDLIIADVPCTGSGTWQRTPEQLYFFKEEKIGHYTKLQQQIVRTALSKLIPGGHFLYITCSAFRQENEGMVEFISSCADIQLVDRALIRGYDEKADMMFAALFINATASV